MPPTALPGALPTGAEPTTTGACEECERQELILDAYKILTEELGRYNTTIWQYPVSLVAANALLFTKTDLLQTMPHVLIAFSILDLAIVYSLFKHILNQETLILRIRKLESGISTALKSVPEISAAFSERFESTGRGSDSIMGFRAATLVATTLWLGSTALGFLGLRVSYIAHATGVPLLLGWGLVFLYVPASLLLLRAILRILPLNPRRKQA